MKGRRVYKIGLTADQCSVAETAWKKYGCDGSGVFADLRVAAGELCFRVYTPEDTAAINATLTAINDKRKAGKAVAK